MKRLTIVTGAVGILALAGLSWYSYNQIQRNKDIIREKKEEMERNKQITTPTADSSEIVAAPPPVTNSNSELTPSLAPPQPKETIDIDWNSPSYLTAQMPAKSIALTLDDGPSKKYTEQVLDILKQHQIQATFFLVGYRVKENCPLVNRIVREGHTLGNHTYFHPKLTKLNREEQKEEIEITQTEIKKCADKLPRWFRAPYGAQNETTLQVAGEVGLNTALWTVDTNDWRKTATSKSIADEVLKSQGQDIVIMHDATDANPKLKSPESSDTRQNTVEALKEIIPQLKKRGFKFVTLDEAFLSPSKPEVK